MLGTAPAHEATVGDACTVAVRGLSNTAHDLALFTLTKLERPQFKAIKISLFVSVV